MRAAASTTQPPHLPHLPVFRGEHEKQKSGAFPGQEVARSITVGTEQSSLRGKDPECLLLCLALRVAGIRRCKSVLQWCVCVCA